MVLELELVQHMDFERAEAATEFDVLGGSDLLVAEHHDVMVEVRAVDAREVGVVDRPGDVEADDFGADRCVEGAHFEVLCGSFGEKNGSHAANVGAGAPFSNELFVASL